MPTTREVIPTIKPEEAVERLRDMGMTISVPTLKQGIKDGVFPFGAAVQNKDCRYYVFTVLFDKWIKERSSLVEDELSDWTPEKGG